MYTVDILDFELARRESWPPESVAVGIGYWAEATVDTGGCAQKAAGFEALFTRHTQSPLQEMRKELAATPPDTEPPEVDLSRLRPGYRPACLPRSLHTWREWELALAERQRQLNPKAKFRRVVETMSWAEYYRLKRRHQNDPAERH